MQRTDLRLLFSYHYWATKRILEAAERISPEQFTRPGDYGEGSVRSILVHALSSERNWRTRWQGGEIYGNLDQQAFPDVETLQAFWQQQEREMRTFLDGCDEESFTQIFTGRTSGGIPFTDPIWHSMMQVLFHGAQHRSEVAELLTVYGSSPGDLDFFIFLRHRQHVLE